jgi:ATP-dependent Zn protease
VKKLLSEADDRAYQLLVANRDLLDRMVEELLIKEELHKEEIDAIFGKKPETNIAPEDKNSFPILSEAPGVPANR